MPLPLPTDTIATATKTTAAEVIKSVSFDDFIQKAIAGIVSFAIHLFVAILVFYIGRWVINKLHSLLKKIFIRRKVDASLSTFVLSLVQMTLYFILVITVIGILGIETTSFIAIFASAGVAIGMALSGTLQNFAGGVLILLLKPYKIGDYIETQGYSGTVKEIQIFHTILNTPDNKSIILPNGGLSTGSINNYSREKMRRVDWSVGISYGDSVESARRALLAILASDQRVEDGSSDAARSPRVFVSELADSSVNLSVRAWVASADYWDVFFEINERIYSELPAASGCSFPFPQLDVHQIPAK